MDCTCGHVGAFLPLLLLGLHLLGRGGAALAAVWHVWLICGSCIVQRSSRLFDTRAVSVQRDASCCVLVVTSTAVSFCVQLQLLDIATFVALTAAAVRAPRALCCQAARNGDVVTLTGCTAIVSCAIVFWLHKG